MNADIMRSALRFVHALDKDDYETVRSMLAIDCRYHARTETLIGRNAITASYRANSRLARRLFEQVEYSGAVIKVVRKNAHILLSDHLRHRGKEHRYKCVQIIHFGSGELIDSIRHKELPGQRDRLLRFCAGNGVKLSE